MPIPWVRPKLADARQAGAPLSTQDADFEGMMGVRYFINVPN